MAVLSIVLYPDKRLRNQAVAVPAADDGIRSFCRDMWDTMIVLDGVGLAASQVGDNRSIFVLNAVLADGRLHRRSQESTDDPLVFINPRIISSSKQEIIDVEGCLSFPGIRAQLKRPAATTVKAIGFDGQPFEVIGDGLWSRAIHHEVEHLHGRLLIDAMSPLKREMIKKQMAKAYK